MTSFVWDEYYATGIDTVDKQHHRLVDLINELELLLSSNRIRKQDIERLLNALTHYAGEHFQDEEALMRHAGIDARHIDAHSIVHQRFIDEIGSLSSESGSTQANTGKDLLDFLTNWLSYHILGMDQNMSRQIRAVEQGMSAADAYSSEEHESDSAMRALLDALDNLFEQVSSRNRALVEFNRTLEQKVQARTQELSRTNKKLEVLSLTDTLTDLPNRRHAIRQFAVLWKEAVDGGTPLSCMMIDADHFKEVNDTCGHDAGDAVLVELARTIRHSVRSDDITARLGGDEFLVICPDTGLEGARQVAGQIHVKVAELAVRIGECEWKGSVSIGVAAITTDMKSYEDLIKRADQSVYEAKSAGKNCIRSM